MVHLLATECAALVEPDVEFVIPTTRAIHVDTIWIISVTRAVYKAGEGAIETKHHLHEVVGALGNNVCEDTKIRFFQKDKSWINLRSTLVMLYLRFGLPCEA